MSKKHYQEIARIIAETKIRYLDTDEPISALAHVALELCSVLKQDNPNFNHEKFLEACK